MSTEIDNNVNPLTKYFRIPGVEVPLPTNGRFMPEGTIELNPSGNIEVFPMQTSDELILTSPDALMSGVAIEKIISSCVPCIKDPSLVSSTDLDVIIIAIRAASNGNDMDMEVECPKCKEKMTMTANLGEILANIKPVPDKIELRIADDCLIYFKPHTLREQTNIMLKIYNENRKIMSMDDDSDITEESHKLMLSQTIDNIQQFQTDSLLAAIDVIMVGDVRVTNREHITEYLRNASKSDLTKMKKEIETINSMGVDRSLSAKCVSSECEHEWKTMLEFNPSTFFVQSS